MANITDILFLDIETVAATDSFKSLNDAIKSQWKRKASFLKKEEDVTDEELFEQRAGIYAEFGKIVCVGLGYFRYEADKLTLRLKSLADDDEKILLQEFKAILQKFNPETLRLCAHNGREFDFPYLSRRMLVNGIKLPSVLNLSGKKPWEINHLDTMEMWKFGDYKHYTSLDLLAALFGITSSKSDIDGSMVNHVYYQDQDLPRIAEYCLRDVTVTAELFLKLTSYDYENIDIVKSS